MFFRRHRTGKRFALAVCLLAAAAASGCSMGYTNLHPGENSAYYSTIFNDVITTYDEPHWLWIRGTIDGDFNGDGKVDEEAVVATIQQGTPREPGPIEKAFLAICKVQEDGTRVTEARLLLFDKDPIPAAPRPVNDIDLVGDAPFTRVRAQLVQDKISLKETVVVYFWGDTLPGSVWYIGYGMESGVLFKNLETVLWQSTPGFLTANLDRSIEASPFGYQLLFSVAAIPPDIIKKLGTAHAAPLWGHVFARDREGMYLQADQRYGEHYRQLENSWNQVYLKALFLGLPPEELAWFEYHMGLMNRYTNNFDMAARFMEKAEKNAKDPDLIAAIRKGVEFVKPVATPPGGETPKK